MSAETLRMGAVAYDPKVSAIWEGFQRYFARHGLTFDFVLYSDYEKQVEAHFSGDIDVAWNSPLAWIESERIAAALGRRADAICMRDSDRDLTSVIVARSDGDMASLEDLLGKRLAVGAQDSPQATLIPLNYIAAAGIRPDVDFEVVRFDQLIGLHGDHIAGECDAFRALLRGEADAASLLEANHRVFSQEAAATPSGGTRIIAATPAYDHCNFTVLEWAPPALVERFRKLLLGMSYADSEVRRLMDLEGLKQWQPGRVTGYRTLSAAVDRFGSIDQFVRNAIQRFK